MSIKSIIKYVVFLTAVVTIAWLNAEVFRFSPQAVRNEILILGAWAPVIYIAACMLRPLILFPASIMSLAGGLAFGPGAGVMYILIGGTGGAILAYGLGRLLGKELFQTKIKGRIEAWRRKLEAEGFRATLLMRLLPVLNFDLVSYVCGLSRVRLSSYTAATVIGLLPGAVGYSFLGSGLLTGKWRYIVGAVSVFAALLIAVVILRKKGYENNINNVNGDLQ